MSDRTELGSLGEFGLIDRLTKSTKIHHASTIKGVGDDAAVLDAGSKFLLVTTDLLVEGVHFDLSYAPLMHLGYKAVVVNLSDIYAMNGMPKQITVSVAVSNRFSVEALEELYAGIHKACSFYEVDLVGGDTTTAPAGLTISVTAIGEVEKDKVVYRSGGKSNELIIVTGDLGAALMGLQVLEREKFVFKENPKIQPQLDNVQYIIERQLKPEARKEIIAKLGEIDVVPTSMIDVSDGLASEILHLCKASDTGAQIYLDRLPIDPETVRVAEEFNLSPGTCALNGGEDYELLFSVKQEDYPKIKDVPGLTVIGNFRASSEGVNIIASNGTTAPIEAQGWAHFRNQD